MKTKLLPALLFVALALVTLTGCQSKKAEFEAWRSKLDQTQPLTPVISVPADVVNTKTFVITAICPDGASCSILWVPGTSNKPNVPKNKGASTLANGKGKFSVPFETIQDGYNSFWAVAYKCDTVPEHLRYVAEVPSVCRYSPQGEIKEVLVDTGPPALANVQLIADDQSFTVTGITSDTGSGVEAVHVCGQKAAIANVNGVQSFSVVVPFSSLVNTTSCEVVASDRGHLRARLPFPVPIPPNRWELWSNNRRRQINADIRFVPEGSKFGGLDFGFGLGVEWRRYEDGVWVKTLDTPSEYYIALALGVTSWIWIPGAIACLSFFSGLGIFGWKMGGAARLVKVPSKRQLLKERNEALEALEARAELDRGFADQHPTEAAIYAGYLALQAEPPPQLEPTSPSDTEGSV